MIGSSTASGKVPNMTITDRIKLRLEALGYTQASVARDAGLKPDYVRDLLRGKKEEVSVEGAVKLANALHCSVNWLLTGEHEHMTSEEVADGLPSRSKRENNGSTPLQPYKGDIEGSSPEIDARAGAGQGAIGDAEVVALERGGAIIGSRVVSEWVFPAAYVRHQLGAQPSGIWVLEVVGDSMSPTLESGDRVIIDTLHARPTPDGVYVIDEGEGPMVKRLQLVRQSDPPQVRIISDNKNHEAYTLRLEDIRIVGRVSGRVTKM